MKRLWIVLTITLTLVFAIVGYVGSGNSLTVKHEQTLNGLVRSTSITKTPTTYAELKVQCTGDSNSITLPFSAPTTLYIAPVDCSITVQYTKVATGTTVTGVVENGFMALNLISGATTIDTLGIAVTGSDTANVYILLAK